MADICLSDRQRHVRTNACLELRINAAIPKDDGSLDQALAILALEKARWEARGTEIYEPSWLARTVLDALHRQIGRKTVAGLTALAMTCLDNAGKRMSLRSAAEVVAEYANSISGLQFIAWKGGAYEESVKPLVGDEATIKKIFREYRSVAHICAAEIAAADYLDFGLPFETKPEADACFISTAIYYQLRLQKAENSAQWGLRKIRFSPPYSIEDYPPLIANEQLVQNLIGPWLDSRTA